MRYAGRKASKGVADVLAALAAAARDLKWRQCRRCGELLVPPKSRGDGPCLGCTRFTTTGKRPPAARRPPAPRSLP